MSKINSSILKELRRRTSVSITDCKKALIESNYNIELAIENLSKFNVIKALKKSNNTTISGVVDVKIEGKQGFILEVNCQTDFVAKNIIFQKFVKKAINLAISKNIKDIKVLKNFLEEDRILLVAKTGENINIRRLDSLEGNLIGFYQHGIRIGVIVVAKNASEDLIKSVAMHIAASKPKFIKPENIPTELLKEIYHHQLSIALKTGKAEELAQKISKGRVKKFIDESSLINQPFIMNPNKLISQLLNEHNSEIINFIRFELGEDIIKNNNEFKKEFINMSDMSHW